ncbi:cytochrome P450 family protein [Amycolatopsis rifamycinica]|uniref:Cytochrome P450 n=1 Tax=Amycolatopsis rifamycinica TaxID=287986 RepID=A0A066TTZ5_9PSEU|nr:cytochrome P450 [Amycolatopsis rifamycinica]KDN18325.1 cytochrome P450 [Amycolatopsis rifamycinica]
MIGKVLAWLPERVVALRMRIFALVNGQDAVTIPGPQVGVADFRRVYADPAANGRSRGAALSDLFWYWLSPGAEVHQEHLEAGPRYDEVAKCTRHILVKSKKDSEELTRRVARHVLDGVRPGLVRLRDEMMPIWAELYYELVFDEPCPPRARELIVAHADDVASALKCVRPRNMRRRARLTKYLRQRLADVPHPLPQSLTAEEQAYYLQGTFFTTAVVQMSEAMAHLLMIIARDDGVQQRLADHPEDIDQVVDDGLRQYPLFGIAHRISTADIELDQLTIPAGTVLCFSYPDFAEQAPAEEFIPFGVAQNRACPARGIAPVTMRVVAQEVLRRFSLASTAAHTRSIPNRGPALLTPRGDRRRRAPLVWLAVRDRWEDVWRSFAQLVFGTYMVLDARRLALCSTYFAGGNR